MASTVSNDTNKPKQLAIPASVFRRINIAECVDHFLRDGKRASGRALDEHSPIEIVVNSTSDLNGSILLRIGDSRMIAALSAHVCAPAPRRPNSGFVAVNVAFSHLGRSQSTRDLEQQRLSAQLQHLLLSVGVVDLDDLTVEPGKAVWALAIDITVIADAGSVLSHAWTALTAVLVVARLPQVQWDHDSQTLRTDTAQPLKPLKLLRPLKMISWICWHGEIICDPDADEETAAGGDAHVALLTADGKVAYVDWRSNARIPDDTAVSGLDQRHIFRDASPDNSLKELQLLQDVLTSGRYHAQAVIKQIEALSVDNSS